MSRETYGCAATGRRWRRLSPRHLHRLICRSRGSPRAPSKFAAPERWERSLHGIPGVPGLPSPFPALGGQQGRLEDAHHLPTEPAGCTTPPSMGTPAAGGAQRGTQGIIHQPRPSTPQTTRSVSLMPTMGLLARPAGLYSNVIFSVRSALRPPPQDHRNPLFAADAVLLCQYPLGSLCRCVRGFPVCVHSQQLAPVSLFRGTAFELLDPALLEAPENYHPAPIPGGGSP